MCHFVRDGFRVQLCGPSGTAALPGYYQPGSVMADPFGGQGGSYHFEFRLYSDGATLVAVATCVTFGHRAGAVRVHAAATEAWGEGLVVTSSAPARPARS